MSHLEESNAVIAVARDHFPGLEITQQIVMDLHPKTLLEWEEFPIVRVGDQLAALDDLKGYLEKALGAHERLHRVPLLALNLKFKNDAAEHKHNEFVVSFSRRTDEGMQAYEALQPVKLLLEHLVRNSRDSIKAAKAAVAELDQLRPKEAPNETISKAFLVDRLREFWSVHRGNPPTKPSPGSPFMSFVADVVFALEKDWDAESTINAWYKRRDLMDRYRERI
ncbi:MAG: hypothetical protein ACFB01_07105 [Cohaesibacteraceae bacterium]